MNRPTPFDDVFERTMGRGFDFDPTERFDGVERFSGRAFDVDVAETDDAVVVTADLPGFDRDDIEVSAANRTLTLRAEHDHADETVDDEYGTYVRRERRHDSVSRSVRLPVEVDESAASASYRNGVLSVSLPKVSASDAAHRIDVE